MTSAYRGRFAPSPTGPLHFGSLVAALASYLEARVADGQWLVRIEDLDPLREPAGCPRPHPAHLETHGLHWDEPIWRQSSRRDFYRQRIAVLRPQGLRICCPCSRTELNATSGRHPYHCRDQDQSHRLGAPWRLRFRVEDEQLAWSG